MLERVPGRSQSLKGRMRNGKRETFPRIDLSRLPPTLEASYKVACPLHPKLLNILILRSFPSAISLAKFSAPFDRTVTVEDYPWQGMASQLVLVRWAEK